MSKPKPIFDSKELIASDALIDSLSQYKPHFNKGDFAKAAGVQFDAFYGKRPLPVEAITAIQSMIASIPAPSNDPQFVANVVELPIGISQAVADATPVNQSVVMPDNIVLVKNADPAVVVVAPVGVKNEVTFTILNSKTNLSKEFSLVNNSIEKKAAAQMYEGFSHRGQLPFEQLLPWMDSANPKQAFCYGTHDLNLPDKVGIVTKGKEKNNRISRTKDYFDYRPLPGVLPGDHDVSEYMPFMPWETMLSLLSQICPGIGSAAKIMRGSVSSGVHLAGELPKDANGYHFYIPVLDASDIPRFGVLLYKWLWLFGCGKTALSRNGSMLERSPLDKVIWSGERMDFVAKPIIVGADLVYTAPRSEYIDGGMLDTSLLADLTPEQEAKFQALVALSKEQVRPAAEKQQKIWINEKVLEMADKGTATEKATEIIQQMVSGGFKDLYSDFVLYFSDGTVTTVAEVLADPKKYNGKSLADPIEGRAYGNSTAIYWANENTKKPIVCSQAHGASRVYFLHQQVSNHRNFKNHNADNIDIDTESLSHDYPAYDQAGFYGIAGEVARLGSEKSEADPIAIYYSFLVAMAAMLGRHKYIRIGDSKHYARIFSVLVGASSRARKGTSLNPVKRLVREIEEIYRQTSDGTMDVLNIADGGLSSAEGLIYAVRDESEQTSGKDNIPLWGAVDDKRLFIVEEEFASVLKVSQREGNNLSPLLRKAWDGGTLAPMTKNNRMSSTDPHVNAIGHITQFELKSAMNNADLHNGLSNRFLWVCVRRTKKLSNPLAMDSDKVFNLATRLANALKKSQSSENNEIDLDNDARDLWNIQYDKISVDRHGVIGSITSRAEAYVLRLALLFSLFDGEKVIKPAHIWAAIHVVNYSIASAEFIFTVPSDESPDAQRLLTALDIKPLSQSAISKLFNGHKTKDKLTELLTDLQSLNKIRKQLPQVGRLIIWEKI